MKEKVFRFRAVEQRIAASHPGFRVLDIGCGRGDNLRRLTRYGGRPIGIEPSVERAHEAAQLAPTATGVGEAVPLSSERFDMVYISHVLHHARDVEAVLRESHRALVPGGLLFVIETIDDSPLMRLARALQPRWDDDEVLNRFHYEDLHRSFEACGFEVLRGEKFNWMYFAWELIPMALRPLEILTPIFIGIETLLHRLLGRRWGGHCWLVARKPGTPVFPDDGDGFATCRQRA
jgi:ubiquinone/menaquinone biosynthesis C-methylase UbiE